MDVGSSVVQSSTLYLPVLPMTERDYLKVTCFSTTDHDISAFLVQFLVKDKVSALCKDPENGGFIRLIGIPLLRLLQEVP